ncbi:glutathione S-transferase family protein (plasmid) [Pantoea vagans C9-1]|jgi:glutathione S-transferase|uniref:glutathione S-transferase n=1 Tax=Pantoea vagans TaxID=470934 RepID=UPI0001D8EF26|nr:glutathione S-transferase [Pantoea vagans]ADI78094.1 glutathione S-transferase family protein [Pantoea vagans C9-1]
MTDLNNTSVVSSRPSMKISDWYDGPYPARVRIALAEKGLLSQVEFIPVNLWKGEHKKPEFLAINYSGTLPVLALNDGTLIAECTAITQYLDVRDDNPLLTGKTPVEKGLIHMMTKRAEIEFLDAVSVYFHHATAGLGPEVELYQNAEWGEKMREKAIRGMHYFDSVLCSQPYVAGQAFSMADIAVTGGMIFSALVNLAVPDECTALKAWYLNIQHRPSYQQWQAMVEAGRPVFNR